MTVKEAITYNFAGTPHHGIFRNIPLVSKVGDLYRVIGVNFSGVERDGEEEECKIQNDANLSKIKIGNPDKTIVG